MSNLEKAKRLSARIRTLRCHLEPYIAGGLVLDGRGVARICRDLKDFEISAAAPGGLASRIRGRLRLPQAPAGAERQAEEGR